jgi:hypothetical protein
MTTTKPSFLGLLNAIAVGEAAAEPLFNTWAQTTSDEDLAKTLRFVGMREGEHAKAFAKRMLELGYEVRQPERPGPEPQRMDVAASTECTDAAKFELLGFGMMQSETDVFDTMFTDKTIDPVTGQLLGRYIAEERDSLRILAADYDRLKAAEVPAAAEAKPAKAKAAKTKASTKAKAKPAAKAKKPAGKK